MLAVGVQCVIVSHIDNRAAASTLLPLAADRGMAVMINLPFGRGRLFQAVQGRELPPWANNFDCARWAQFFLKYIVSHPAVTCCVPGTAKVEYLLDNLGAAQGRLPDAAMRRQMEKLIDRLLGVVADHGMEQGSSVGLGGGLSGGLWQHLDAAHLYSGRPQSKLHPRRRPVVSGR